MVDSCVRVLISLISRKKSEADSCLAYLRKSGQFEKTCLSGGDSGANTGETYYTKVDKCIWVNEYEKHKQEWKSGMGWITSEQY